MTDQELKDLVASLAINSAKTDAQLAKTDAQLAKTDTELRAMFARMEKSSAKTDAQLAKTDTELRAMFARMEKSSAKTDVQLAKTDAQLAKTDAQLAKTDAQLAKTATELRAMSARMEKASDKTDAKLNKLGNLIGNISNNQGEVIEELFYNSLKKKKQLGSIKFDYINRNLKLAIGKLQDEYDIVLFNGDSVAILEVKNKLHPKDIKIITEQKTNSFKELRAKKLEHQKIYMGFATAVSNNELIDEAKKAGAFLLTSDGNHIELMNKDIKAY